MSRADRNKHMIDARNQWASTKDGVITLKTNDVNHAYAVGFSHGRINSLSSYVINSNINPDKIEVKQLRESLQENKYIGITAAQDLCASFVHTSRRAWQQWENGDRKMHPAFWELVRIKINDIPRICKR